MKKCSKCKELKSYDNFFKNKCAKDGYQNQCKICLSQTLHANPFQKNLRYNERHLLYSEEFPAPSNSVYGLFHFDELIYIGESKMTPYRLYDHFSKHSGTLNNYNVDECHYEILWKGRASTPVEYRRYQEKQLIDLHRPKLNIL